MMLKKIRFDVLESVLPSNLCTSTQILKRKHYFIFFISFGNLACKNLSCLDKFEHVSTRLVKIGKKGKENSLNLSYIRMLHRSLGGAVIFGMAASCKSFAEVFKKTIAGHSIEW